jgi:hypothetical protein
MTFYWYLATPYSKYPHGLLEAWKLACRNAAVLVKARVPVLSPIAHSHPVAAFGGMDPLDLSVWLEADRPLMEGAGGLIVLKAQSWELSVGIAHEIDVFTKAGKPIVYMEPDELPAAFARP